MLLRSVSFALALVLLPACSADAQQTPPQSGVYRTDPRHTSVTFSAGHMGLSRTVGRFNRAEATLTLDADAPERSSLTATIETASVDSGLDSFDDFLRSARFMNSAANPQITFQSTRIERTGPSTARVIGDLTLNGATHEETLDATFNSARPHPFDGRFMTGFSATATISRAQFGLTAFADMVTDEIAIEIEAELALTPS